MLIKVTHVLRRRCGKSFCMDKCYCEIEKRTQHLGACKLSSWHNYMILIKFRTLYRIPGIHCFIEGFQLVLWYLLSQTSEEYIMST